jgi:hypothetical protein
MRNKLIKLLALAAVGSTCWLGIAASDKQKSETSWHMCFSNGVSGPVSVCEISADGSRILRELPVQHQNTDTNTQWLGSPITGEALGGGPAKGLLDQRQEAGVVIGLKADGTVVWRRR